jgi:hypothetical protein
MRRWLLGRLHRSVEFVAGRSVSPVRDAASAPEQIGATAPDYPQLREALSRHLREVGDFVELGRHRAAREALLTANAIESELKFVAPWLGTRDARK